MVASPGLLARLGLGRPELRAWALYDWANSAFVTIVITAVFPPYFTRVAAAGLQPAEATSRFALTTTIALAVVAVLAPVLGSMADRRPLKKRMLAAFLALGVTTTVLLATVREGDIVWGLALFGLANIGVSGSFVFYDSLLPHIARPDEIDRVSTAGYALGYLGGGLLLAVSLLAVMSPSVFGLADGGQAARASFVAVAVWWILFSVPLFRRVPEPAATLAPAGALRGLMETFRELRRYPQALLLMVAFLIYNDGIQTIIRMAAIFGAEIGLTDSTLIGAILMVQFVGIPCTFVFGQLAARIGPKRAVLLAIGVYAAISILGYAMTEAWHFWVLAGLVGLVQGGCQALSRSLFASLIPRERSSEMFGLFAVFEKFAGIFGPALFGAAVAVTGSSRVAILSVILFFIVGGALLWRVDVEAGRRAVEPPAGA